MTKIIATVCAVAMLAGTSIAQAMPNDPDTTPGGRRFCKQYASTTASVVADALKRNPRCLNYSKGVHSNYLMHYNWCMRTPRSEVDGAGMHIRDLVRLCTATFQRPRPFSGGQTTWYCKATSNSGASGWARRSSMRDARSAAMAECYKRASHCQLQSCNRQ